jgi:hypothetical protein
MGIEEGDAAVWREIVYLVDDYFTDTQPGRPTRTYVPIAADVWTALDADFISAAAFERPSQTLIATNLGQLLRGAAGQVGGIHRFAVHVLPPDPEVDILTGGVHAPCISVWSGADERATMSETGGAS